MSEKPGLSHELIWNSIEASTAEHNHQISSLERAVISELLSTLPAKKMEPADFTRWCTKHVDLALSKLPENGTSGLVEKVRKDVRSEALFEIYKPRFVELKAKIQALEFVKISPRELERLDVRISTVVGTITGDRFNPEWLYVIKKMGIEDQFTLDPSEARNHVMQELVMLLERLNPSTFDQLWIESNDEKLFGRLLVDFRATPNSTRINWEIMAQELPGVWRTRWNDTTPKSKYEKIDRYSEGMYHALAHTELTQALNQLKVFEILDKEKPEAFNVHWMLLRFPQLASMGFNYKSKRKWQAFADVLPTDLRKKWKDYNQPQEGVYQGKEEVEELTKKYGDKFYTFLSASTEEELKTRKDITNALVRLAQHGNAEARAELINLLTYYVSNIIDQESSLAELALRQDIIFRILDKTIMEHDFTEPFFESLEGRIKAYALYLPKGFAIDEVGENVFSKIMLGYKAEKGDSNFRGKFYKE